MTAQDPALTQALDRLTVQVNRDNILAAHKAFQDHADTLRSYLQSSLMTMEMRPCGNDPVSQDVLGPNSFAGKIGQLLQVHWDHCRELEVAAEHLREVARTYGYTDDEITHSLGSSGPVR